MSFTLGIKGKRRAMMIAVRERAALAVILISILCGCQSAGHIAPAVPAESSACSSVVASVSDVNALELFEGAVACSRESRQEDTNFLMIVGQIRAISDLTILTPLDDENSQRASELYMQLYYNFGGLGFDELYRAPANVSALEERVRQTDLSFASGYNPGWEYRPSSKTDIYSAIASNAREQRLWQMRNMALKLQDDEYYEVHLALAELQRENPVFHEGTPPYEEHSRLMARLRDAAADIPELPQPEDTTPYARLNEQDPELSQRQVMTGFNGPTSQGTFVFRSEAEVRQSWLARALSDQQLESLIARTDFSTQVLVGFSFGKRMNASGQIMISELAYREDHPGYTIAARIGVVPESCGVTLSYPFVIGLTEAVPGAEVRGYSSSNFPDECRPVISGAPAPPN